MGPHSVEGMVAGVPARRGELASGGLVRPRPMGGPPALNGKPDAIALLKALRRRWVLALFGGLICATLGGLAGVLTLAPQTYTSSSLIAVSEQPPRDIFTTQEQQVSFDTYKRTQMALIRRREVLKTAVENPKATSVLEESKINDPIPWLTKNLELAFEGETLRISLTSENPRLNAELVNCVTDAYLTKVVDQERQARVDRQERLGLLYADLMSEVQREREKFKSEVVAAGSSSQKSALLKQTSAAEEIGQWRRELVQLQSRIREAEIQLRYFESAPKKAVEPKPVSQVTQAAIDQAVKEDAQAQELATRINTLKAEYNNISKIARNANSEPASQHRKAEIDRLTAEWRARYVSIRRALEQSSGNESPEQEAPVELESLRQAIAMDREREAWMVSLIAQLDKDFQEIDVRSVDIDWRQRALDLREATAQKVGEVYEALAVELSNNQKRVSLLEEAQPEGKSDPTRKIKMAGMSAASTLGLFLASLAFWEFMTRRVDEAGEVTRDLGINLIGALPALPRGGRDVELQRRVLVESVDAIRTILLHASQVDNLQAIMVTSATKGEGKSSLASHLAISLARAGRKTLLLDCDLRNPAQHRLFDQPLGPGVCELLRGEAELIDAIRPTPVETLSLIPAGRCDLHAINGLSRAEMVRLFQELRALYEFIIVDSAPVLLVTDPLIVGQHVDAAVLSVLRNVSRLPALHSTCTKLSAVGIRLLGGVLAGVRGNQEGYGYYNVGRDDANPIPGRA